MTDASDLWAAVVASYDIDGLITLTNIRVTDQDGVNTTVGESAAQAVIDLWPVYAEEDYAASNATHVEIGKEGVIAVLWRRGGSATSIAEVKWTEVFGDSGMISRVMKTGPRGRQGPSSNSGVSQKSETVNGRSIKGWSDRDASGADFMTASRKLAD